MSGNVEQPAISRDEQNLAVSIIQFLRETVLANQQSPDLVAAIGIAISDLETAFALTDGHYAFQPSKPLLGIFKDSEGVSDQEAVVEKANKLKEEGNELVKKAKYQEAIDKYSGAIKLYQDPIYFCNRAVTYCYLKPIDLATQDCHTAISLDSTYAQPHGVLGVLRSGQNRYQEAVNAYKEALELEPSNGIYKKRLKEAEEKLRGEFNVENTAPGFSSGDSEQSRITNLIIELEEEQARRNKMGTFAGQGASQQTPNTDGPENSMRGGEQMPETASAQNPERAEQLRQQSHENAGTGKKRKLGM